MSLKSLSRDSFIFVLWTIIFFVLFRFWMRAMWNFDIVVASHWQFIFEEWWYHGWVIEGAYYWSFLIFLFLFIPMWIWGAYFLIKINYTNLMEKLFLSQIYDYKAKKNHKLSRTMKVKKNKKYTEVRPPKLEVAGGSLDLKPMSATADEPKSSVPAMPVPPKLDAEPDILSFEDEIADMIKAHEELPNSKEESKENRVFVEEDLEQIMKNACLKVISGMKFAGMTLDYVAVGAKNLYLCLLDKEKGEWLADEEEFGGEEPLWFSETSHRTSPIYQLLKVKDKVKEQAEKMGISVQPVLIKTDGDIINAEDMGETWDKLGVWVCRTGYGWPDILPTFSMICPSVVEEISDEDFVNVLKIGEENGVEERG